MIYVHTLGTARIDAGNARVKPSATKRFALLLYLAAEPTRRVSRAALHDLLFPELAEKNAGHALRELIYKVRQMGIALDADADGVSLGAEAVRSDYSEVIEAERPDASQLRAIEGGFLPGYAPAHSEAFTEWYEGYRARTTFDLCRAVLREVARTKAAGDWRQTETAARACLALDSLNEEATLVLAEALAIGGSKVQAVRLLDSYASEVGHDVKDLKIPAATLRRRIGERTPADYRLQPEPALVGREPETSRLRQHLARSRVDASQFVLMLGEPGVGKSRLASQFETVARLEGFRVQRVVAQPLDIRRPMGAFIDLVPSLRSLPGALGCAPEALEALARLTSHSRLELPAVTQFEVEPVSRAITRAIGDLVEAVSSENPLAIVLEDAHWLDDLSIQTMAELCARKTESRICVLAASRSLERFQPFLASNDSMSVLRVGALTASDSTALAEIVLSGTGASADMIAWVATTAGGNPLFVRTLGAHYSATRKQFDVPSTLIELITQRIGIIGPRAFAVLYACVALGKRCAIQRLADVVELPHSELATALRELGDANLIHDDGTGIRAAHPLIAEAAQNRPRDPVLTLTHARIARVLESEASAENSPTLSWDCAEHWRAAGNDERALIMLRICAAHAIEIGRPREAAQTLRYAMSLSIDDDRRLALLREAIRLARLGAEHNLILEYTAIHRQYKPLTEHDDVELSELNAMALIVSHKADFERRALHCIKSAKADVEHRVRAGIAGLKFADVHSDVALATAIVSAISEGDLASVDPAVRNEFELVYHTSIGDTDVAERCAHGLCAQAALIGGVRAATMYFNAAVALWRCGAAEASIQSAETAYRLAEQAGGARLCMTSALQLAGTLFDTPSTSLAREWLAVAEARARELGLLDLFELIVLKLEMLLADGETTQARRILRNAWRTKAFTNAGKVRWYRCYCLRLRQLGVGRPVSDAEINASLSQPIVNNPISGLGDFEIATAIHHFDAKGEIVEARDVAKRYLRSRPTRAPITRSLQRAIHEAGCDDLLDGFRISVALRPYAPRAVLAGA